VRESYEVQKSKIRKGAPRIEEIDDWEDNKRKVQKIQMLRKTQYPTVQAACDLVDVRRTTYYNWLDRMNLEESQ
jgi:hypothetical protein